MKTETPTTDILHILKIKKPYYPNYVILFDPTLEQVDSLSKSNESLSLFIWIFITVFDYAINWNLLPENEYIIQPIYIGDIKEKDRIKAVIQIIGKTLSET